MKRPLPRLWLITDRRQTSGGLLRAIEAALSAVPPRFAGILLREKDLGGRELLTLARQIRSLSPAPLVINGRVDVALACGADGVHLGGDAPAFEDLRAMAGDLLVGVSLHHDEVPPDGVDYALISPIFETRSKPGAQPLGLEGLRLAASRTQVPLFALGGITASNAADCLRAGAAGVAVREAVLLSNDPREAMKPFT